MAKEKKEKLATNVDGWAPIPGFPNHSAHVSGIIRHDLTGTIIRPRYNNKGYLRINIWKDGKHTTVGIHNLVALAHIANPESKPCINHIDGNKINNHVDNLEWVTVAENNRHAFKNGLITLDAARIVSAENRKKAIALISQEGLKIFRGLQPVADYLGVSCRTIARYIASGKQLAGFIVKYY